LRIDIAVFDGMDELDAIGPLEVLRRAAFDVRLAALGAQGSVRCGHGLVLEADGELRDDAEVLIFPGGGWNDRAPIGTHAEVESKRWLPVIEKASARGAILASVCTGAMILASAGVLRNRRATTHHSAWHDLEASGAILVEDRVVDDGNIITAGGVTSGIDLGLWLVERFANRELATRIAENLEYQPASRAC